MNITYITHIYIVKFYKYSDMYIFMSVNENDTVGLIMKITQLNF